VVSPRVNTAGGHVCIVSNNRETLTVQSGKLVMYLGDARTGSGCLKVGRENLTSLPVADHDGQKPSNLIYKRYG